MDDGHTAPSGGDAAPRERAQARAAIDDERLAALVFESSSQGLLVTDLDGRIVRVNPAFCRLTGYAAGDLAGANPRVLASGRQDRAFYDRLWAELLATGRWEGEVWDRKKSGEVFPEWLTLSTVRDERGTAIGYAGHVIDITARKAADERIRSMAQFDPLTRLPNRTLLGDRLGQAFAAAQRAGTKVAVLFLDLDRFKAVNDSLGHHMGDVLLQEVASRLKAVVRGADTVARLGGDEFVVVLTDARSASLVAAVTEKIVRALGQPFALGAREVLVTPSIGISLFPDDAIEPEDVLRAADAAMYEVKQRGRNGYRFFTHEVEARAAEALALEHDVAAALDRGELLLHWQPEIDLATGRVTALEALLRWQRPGAGLVPTARFLPLAEERGLGGLIGEWVLATACEAARGFQRDAGAQTVRVAINLSLQDVRQPRLARHVAEVAASAGVDLTRLDLEIGEATFLLERDRAAELVAEGRALGLQFSVDNFGTGFSSLAQLRRLPIRQLKMDGSVLRGAPGNADAAAVAAAILGLSATLGVRASAEQVETPAELAFLRGHGCNLAQGSLFCPPISTEEATALLRRGSLAPPA